MRTQRRGDVVAAVLLIGLPAVLPGTAAWTLNMIVTWAVAGLGMFCFRRALRLASLASFLGAFSFTFAGGMSAQVTHFGLVAGLSWVPVALLSILRLGQDRPARSRLGWIAVLATAVGLMILAGEPRAIDDAGVILLIYAGWQVARLGRRAGPLRCPSPRAWLWAWAGERFSGCPGWPRSAVPSAGSIRWPCTVRARCRSAGCC
jgi:hypothetical protein